MAEPGHMTRHLLALSGASVTDQALQNQPGGLALLATGAAACVLLILILVLCACVKPKESKKNGITLTQVTPKPDRRSTTSAEGPDKQSNVESVTVIQENGNPSRQSDGSAIQVQIDQDAKSGSKTEKRALPQVPLSNVASSTEDFEDDGNYDIIPHSLADATASRHLPIATAVVTDEQNDSEDNTSALYSEVGNNDSKDKTEPPYSKIKNSKTEPPYSKVKSPNNTNSNPYVKVDNVGVPSYAKVSERPNNLPGAITADGEENYAAVAPPVPDKRFSGEGEETSDVVTSDVKQTSPDLPPRNMFLAGGDIHPHPLSPPLHQDEEGTSPPAAALHSPLFVPQAQPAKREPPYSEVTARESISSIRQREETERKIRDENADAFYETVNYEQINNVRTESEVKYRKPSENAAANMSQRGSLSSDLYAEISAEPGDNSTRSAPYQRVADVRRDMHAPTPPPVESLKHLSLHGCPVDPNDSTFDPGYAKINKRSTIHRSTVMDNQRTEEELSLMYAVVDKSHKRSQSDGSAHGSFGRATNISQLYAQVDKSAKKSASPANLQMSPKEYEGTGARPKIRTNARLFQSPRKSEKKTSQSEFSDPGYDTVKDLPDNYDTINIDPGYEKIKLGKTNSTSSHNSNVNTAPPSGDRLSQLADPFYEQVNMEEVLQGLHDTGHNHADPNLVQMNMVTRQASVNTTDHNVVHDDPWLRREPLYQEITEPQKQKQKDEKSKKRSSHKGTVL